MGFSGQFRRLWARFWLQRTKFSSRYGNLKRLYAVEDPWNLTSPQERTRFEETNHLIRTLTSNCATLLEIGCGEGVQTKFLLQVSDAVVGIDVSPIAIRRAQHRLPQAEFHVGRAEDAARLFCGRRFDLVTACEVLYYASDIPAVIAALQQITDTLLVTNYSKRAEKMGHYFTGPGWSILGTINAGDTRWACFVWRADRT